MRALTFITMKKMNDPEMYFTWWANELEDKGLSKGWEFEPISFDIFDSDIISFTRFMAKGNEQINTKMLFGQLKWEPDFCVIMHRSLEGKMFAIIDTETEDNRLITPDNFKKEKGNVYQETYLMTTTDQIIDENWIKIWFDVKPPAYAAQRNGSLGSIRDFRYLQRIMFYRHKIYVNKVITDYGKESKTNNIDSLFVKTFLPKRYKFTNKSRGLRKLKRHEMSCRTLENYLEYKELNI